MPPRFVLPAALTALVLLLLAAPVCAQAPADADVLKFASDYSIFLDASRTPWEVGAFVQARATRRGFEVADATEAVGGVVPGARLFFSNRGMASVLVIVGKQPVESGMRMVIAHADVPSLLLTTAPLGGRDVATLLAQPYGGIKRHQYEGLPLELRGRVWPRGGDPVDVRLGGAEGFVFMVRDLTTTPVLQDAAPRSGEPLALIAASTAPAGSTAASPVRLEVLRALHDRFGLTEQDLDTAALYAVPTWPVRDVGLDRMALGGFGHDDRVCAFAGLRALLDAPANAVPDQTLVLVLTDREEVGSTGPTGMQSEFFRMVIGALLEAQGGASENRLRRAMRASSVLSSDVTAAINPLFTEVQEPMNAPIAGRGPAMMKYTGHGGKFGGSDANPEFVRDVQDVFDTAHVPLQTSEIGRVDEGGGGTIARYLAEQGALVLDLGVGLLSMHSPFEIVHKRDLWWLQRGFSAFLWAPRPPVTPP